MRLPPRRDSHDATPPGRELRAAVGQRMSPAPSTINWSQHNFSRIALWDVIRRLCRRYPREFPMAYYTGLDERSWEQMMRLVNEIGRAGQSKVLYLNELQPEEIDAAAQTIAAHFGIEEG